MTYDRDLRDREKKEKSDVLRDDRGKWMSGPSPNPNGRPRREVEIEYLNKTIESVSLSDWQLIVSKAVEDAKRGDAQARIWLGNYVVGKPTDRIAVIDEQEELNVELTLGNPTIDIQARLANTPQLLDKPTKDDNENT